MVRFQKSQSQVCSSYTVYRNIHFFNYLFKTVEGISFFYWFRENIPYFCTKLWDTFNPMIIHSLYKCYTEVMGCPKSYFCLSKYSYLKWGILYNLPHFHYKYLNIPMLNRNLISIFIIRWSSVIITEDILVKIIYRCVVVLVLQLWNNHTNGQNSLKSFFFFFHFSCEV